MKNKITLFFVVHFLITYFSIFQLNGSVIANFTDSVLYIGCGITNMQFTDNSTGSSLTGWNWNFGDGASAAQQNPMHSYSAPGTYTVSLIVNDSAGFIDTVTNNVIVPGPSGTFSFNPSTGCAPLTITFTAVSATAISYTWDFGDGTVITGPNPVVQYTYTQDIVAVPALILGNTLPDSSFCQVPAPMAGIITVHGLPNVTFVSITDSLCVYNSAIALSGNPSGGIYSGTGVSGSNFDPAVSGAGTFTLSYVYSDTNSCSVTDSLTISVSLCTEIITELKDAFISIYPNPTNNAIYIKMDPSIINQSTIELYNAIGKLVLVENIVTENTSIVLNSLSNGIYTVRIVSNMGQMVHRIIKE